MKTLLQFTTYILVVTLTLSCQTNGLTKKYFKLVDKKINEIADINFSLSFRTVEIKIDNEI